MNLLHSTLEDNNCILPSSQQVNLFLFSTIDQFYLHFQVSEHLHVLFQSSVPLVNTQHEDIQAPFKCGHFCTHRTDL